MPLLEDGRDRICLTLAHAIDQRQATRTAAIHLSGDLVEKAGDGQNASS
jgi:hypothetical protein